jgi:DNA-directed RNA polymerase subunit N (RpoN/RPB10)
MYTITETPFTPRTLEDGTQICEHCGEQIGMHYQHADGRIVCVRFTPAERRDAETGMAWFNTLPEYSRAAWLAEAGSAIPADAWAAYKRTLLPVITQEQVCDRAGIHRCHQPREAAHR